MDRREKLKKRLFEKEYYTKKEFWGEGSTILTSEEIIAEPLVVRKAMATAYMLENMPAAIKPDELIVGIANMSSCGMGRVFTQYATDEEKAAAYKMGFSYKSSIGHCPPDYAAVLHKGVKGLKAEIFAQMEKQNASAQPDGEKLNYYRAMLMALDGFTNFIKRYETLAVKASLEEKDPVRRKELLHIAEICGNVAENPAKTFHEAVQLCWFIYAAHQSTLEYVPVARADQYLYPYYKKDIEEGRLTREEAREIVASWLVKFSERVQMNSKDWEMHDNDGEYMQGGNPDDLPASFDMENGESYNFGTSANHWMTNLIIGGVDRDGKDATNDLTYDILEQWAYLELVCPVLSVRISKQSPEELLDACSRVLRVGSGEPAMYNDEAIIEALVKKGYPLEDARDYSNDGCWEVLIPGKMFFYYHHLEVLRLLEYTLFRGKSLVTGRKDGIDVGDPLEFKSFEDLYTAFLKQVKDHLHRMLDIKANYYPYRSKIAPVPLFSAMTDDCINRGLDAYTGGAKYDLMSPIVTGIANCVDSLNVLKQEVFEKKEITMQDMLHMLETNFEGQEAVRQLLVNKCPKFGNDEDEADEMCARVLDDIARLVEESKKDFDLGDSVIGLGIGTFENYARFGHNCGASADGRKSQEAVSSNYSPSIGMDLEGPTAAMKSITKPNLLPYFTGCPLDIQINSNEVKDESGIKRISALIRAFNELGGLILTITGVSSELLEDAQKNPMQHQSLRVRMGGLSAYFIQLTPEMQDTMIRKTKHSV